MKKNKNNEDLLKLKIYIDSSSDSCYQEMALLVDNPEFLRMLPKLRKDLEIDKLVPINEYENKAYKDPFESTKQKKIDFSKYKNPKYLKAFAKKHITYFSVDLDKKMDYCQFLDTEINFTCIQFNRPPHFSNVVRQAVFCGMVNEITFMPTYYEVIEDDKVGSSVASFELPRVAIMVSPTSTYESVKTMFKLTKELYKTDKRLAYYKPRLDFVNNIRQYRLWYWQRLEGKTYQKIADNYIESKLPARYNTTYLDVMKGVKIYQKLLNS